MAQTLQDSLKAVLNLQGKWSAENTPAMQERGELIRNAIPAFLKPLALKYGMTVEGSDGSGNKNRVPWVRIYDPRFSPSAMEGWYVVFLIAADGSAVFLSLNQGTTKLVNGSFVPIEPEILSAKVKDARSKLDDPNVSIAGLLETINLRDPGNRGRSYENGNAYAIRYETIPEDAAILSDASRLLDLLKILYVSAIPPAETSDAAYLLAWNPENFPWDSLPGLAMQYRSGEQIAAHDADATWTVANKSVKPGDRLFLIRLGKEPKGIVGSGYSLSAPFQGQHYSGESGKTATYVQLKWDALLDPERDKVLPLVELRQRIPEVNWTTNNSGIVIAPNARSRLEQMWKSHLSGSTPIIFTMDNALADVFLDRNLFEEICEVARLRKNIVLQGPPGVGKTFIAKRLAYVLLGAKDNSRLEWVQFHQSYSYEDFILGFRPNGAGFELKPGIFYRFCQQKASTDNRTHVFVIDEINRGNLSRIFGEVLSLIEEDKRGELSVALPYADGDAAKSNDSDLTMRFSIPPNVILVGLMNTADRSLAVVDYALRRRFAFIDLEPRFDDPKFDAILAQYNISQTMRGNIRNRVQDLNSRISSDKRNLGHGFEIGHSFFCPKASVQDEEKWFRSIIKYEIKPLLMEYWFDDPDKATREVHRLLGENPD